MVFNSENWRIDSIIGRIRVVRNLVFSNQFNYTIYGPKKIELENQLNLILNHESLITNKEREIIIMVAKGLSLKEIAASLHISKSAVEKRLIPLYKKFNVNSLTHLVSYCYENKILP